MPKPWQNGEGYADPTAYEALKAVDRQEAEQQKKVNALIGVLKYIINAAGFDLLARIELKDRQTGEGIPVKLNCSRCAYFYKTMVGAGGTGYNPAPFCHYFEDTGNRANILTQKCFKPKKSKRGGNKA